MNLRVLVAAAASLVLVSTIGVPGEGGASTLTRKETNQLLTCQEAIKSEGRLFIREKLRKLESCADRLLEPTLQFENGLLTQEEFDAALARAQEFCDERLAEITRASTQLVDGIVAKCQRVEHLIFGDGDPLRFQGLISFIESFTGPLWIDTAEELAGAICIGKEFLVDIAVILEIPRALELLDLFSAIPLDPRCLGQDQE
jgi:hypothetical protein